MPRKSRIDAGDALHHIMVRGIERGVVRNDPDMDQFGAIRRNSPTHEGLLLCIGGEGTAFRMSFMERELTISTPAISEASRAGARGFPPKAGKLGESE